MKREELLQVAKPILFNTDMVRAILDGRKTMTRRVIKLKYDNTHHEIKTDKYGTRLIEIQDDVKGETFGIREDGTSWRKIRPYIEPKAPYKKGDILYVRETWHKYKKRVRNGEGLHIAEIYGYKASIANSEDANEPWHPSIHMPKEAARIFLKVTNVRVERLQEITWQEAAREGCYGGTGDEPDPLFNLPTLRGEFQKLWDSTCKKNLQIHGWCANPWVWVIEFEKVVEE